MTAVFGHGHLRLYLLSLLEEAPRHGYELIQALEERFGGTYAPSPGTIYPRLAKLEAEGLVTKAADGRKSVYAITDAGKAELAARAGELDGIENEVTDSVRRLADEVRSSVNSAMKTLRADLASAARDARTEAKETAKSWKAEDKTVRLEGRNQLQEAELILSEFRQGIRTELRQHVVRGELSATTVAVLKTGLDGVSAAVREALKVDHH